MDLTQTRYVAITLTEPEWESLRAIQPDPLQLAQAAGAPVDRSQRSSVGRSQRGTGSAQQRPDIVSRGHLLSILHRLKT